MPRVVVLHLGPLWLAFTLNDFNEPGKPRFGITLNQARRRAAAS